ncbi:hypothetical protein TBLA_0I02330 [Henningerozyma blattae CBS 6284]|uniref:ENTH domain-containing protein n=1 Tax=Henningerozyma blattae (strain ATCC 34711 / CBS 6284 / DSM 70876 / NBRC 10599 / NRRL Y-10934 / UCD 77-7) TaxID=1071380 RepID=I2H939_HENB6|nr:hypothetical protein TBLA_0I02330 [Tetrapisispora blattae CBS 6284]CCH62891.1 hypothetical protein TBLA_0I02330 [Tetrapisispora blattae CBS 6284]
MGRGAEDINRAIRKALSVDEAPPKRKHVRAVVLFTWDNKSAKPVFDILKNGAFTGDDIQLYKMLFLIHKVIQEGHESTLKEAIRNREWIRSLINTHHNNSIEGSGSYDRLINGYTRLLLDKLAFHNFHSGFKNGAFEHQEYVTLKYINDPNEGYETIMDLIRLEDSINKFQKEVFMSVDRSSNPNTSLKLVTLVPLISESFGIYQYIVNMITAIQSQLADEDSILNLKRNALDIHEILFNFFADCSTVKEIDTLVTIPKLPKEPPDFSSNFDEEVEHMPTNLDLNKGKDTNNEMLIDYTDSPPPPTPARRPRTESQSTAATTAVSPPVVPAQRPRANTSSTPVANPLTSPPPKTTTPASAPKLIPIAKTGGTNKTVIIPIPIPTGGANPMAAALTGGINPMATALTGGINPMSTALTGGANPMNPALTGGALVTKTTGGVNINILPPQFTNGPMAPLKPTLTASTFGLQPNLTNATTSQPIPTTFGLNPQLTSGLNPQLTSGLNPQLTSGLNPQLTSGLNPQLTSNNAFNMQPNLTSNAFNMNPPINANSFGLQPQLTSQQFNSNITPMQQQHTNTMMPMSAHSFDLHGQPTGQSISAMVQSNYTNNSMVPPQPPTSTFNMLSLLPNNTTSSTTNPGGNASELQQRIDQDEQLLEQYDQRVTEFETELETKNKLLDEKRTEINELNTKYSHLADLYSQLRQEHLRLLPKVQQSPDGVIDTLLDGSIDTISKSSDWISKDILSDQATKLASEMNDYIVTKGDISGVTVAVAEFTTSLSLLSSSNTGNGNRYFMNVDPSLINNIISEGNYFLSCLKSEKLNALGDDESKTDAVITANIDFQRTLQHL